MTTGPLAGPASAYPTLRTPASFCLSGAKDVFVPGLTAGTSAGFMFDCAAAEPFMPNWAAATVMAAVAAAAEVARMLRLVGDEDSADIIILSFSSVRASQANGFTHEANAPQAF